MEVLNCNWQTDDFQLVQNIDLFDKGCFIWVIKWDKIPHLGLSLNGKYFSQTVQGTQINESCEKHFRWIQRNETPAFFVQIQSKITLDDITEVFAADKKIDDTCLKPIRKVFGIQESEVQTLTDLLRILEFNQRIKQFYSAQNVSLLSLKSYTKNDVLELIQKMKSDAFRK